MVSGCDAADDVRVQPLPSLDAASPEARAGLPVVSGLWRFAGWELAPGDTGRVQADLPGFGELRLETQRLDSIAGSYLAGGAALPLIGEVRRDSVLALAGGGRFLTGRVTADTLWLSLTSLLEPGAWPDDARAAFVRSAGGTRFVRVKGQRPTLAVSDSLATDSARMAGAGETPAASLAGVVPRRGVTPLAGKPFPTRPAPVAGVAPRRGTPLTGQPFPTPTPRPQPGETRPRMGEARPPQAAPQPPEPRRADPQDPTRPPGQVEPEPQAAEPEEAEPEPEQAEPEQRRRRPRLLGVPVDSLYSPTAARAISRPGEVSASR